MINALNVLRYYFFDSMPEIQVEGDIGEIPVKKIWFTEKHCHIRRCFFSGINYPIIYFNAYMGVI